jgi:hypothetical protein
VPTVSTYYTIANAPFFPGLVALLNSLRLSGNAGELVVLDRGLTPEQRALVGPHVRLVELGPEEVVHPTVLKPFPHALHPRGVIMLVDSDMLVVRSLDRIAERAAAGRVCLFPDPIPDRWHADWAELLELRAPVRRGRYLNTGFVALDVDRWPSLLERWWQLCARIPPGQVFGDYSLPFWASDQDVLNALLRSELPEDAVDVLPEAGEAFPEQLLRVRVTDERTLSCELDGGPATILHYSLGPKAWQRHGWLRLRDDAYVQLLPRVLFADDVTVRLDPRELPFIVRPGTMPATVRRSLDAVHGSIRAAAHAMPGGVRERLIDLRNRAFRPLGG